MEVQFSNSATVPRPSSSWKSGNAPLPPGYCEHRFLDLCHGVMLDLLELDMRKVGHLVGRHDDIDDGGAVNLEGLADLRVQLAGLRGLETMAATGAGKRRKIRIGEFNALPVSGQAYALRLQRDQPERGIIVDHNLHRQLVVHGRQELAHEHVEAAVAAKRNDLA